jgi:2'-5' RNA ligase
MIMQRFRKFLEMKNTQYDYSSVHVDVPTELAEDIISWGSQKIPDSEIFVSQTEPSFGREDEMHVTILYGIHSETSEQVRKLITDKPLKVKLGKIDVFTNPQKFDVVVIGIDSPDLCDFNEKMKDDIEYTNKYSEYKPHITIAYVKKGKGWKHKGNNKWEGKEFSCDKIVFSSKNGTKERIIL